MLAALVVLSALPRPERLILGAVKVVSLRDLHPVEPLRFPLVAGRPPPRRFVHHFDFRPSRAGAQSGSTRDYSTRRREGMPLARELIMRVFEAKLDFQLVHCGDDEPLTTTKRLLAYLSEGLPENSQESFWIVCMNLKRRPICRLRLATGPLVAAQVGVRDVLRAVLLAEARALACLRTECGAVPHPTLADGRLLFALRETAKHTNIELADYIIAKLDSGDYHSWREHDRRAE